MITTEELYQIYLQRPTISTDTRKIARGSLFFALKGEKFDANTFAEQAIAAGAAYAIIDNPEYQLDEKYLLVEEVLTALQHLARHHRKQLTMPVIGLTGSNGKTTTKELIYSVLAQKFKTLATQGNLNNHIGVPLTVLSINKTHQMAVIEMGANHQREIALLCSISQPALGLITNVGKAHLEGFGGVEGVKKGKGELYDYLSLNDGTTFINSNSATLMEMRAARNFKIPPVFYGDAIDGLVSAALTANSPYLSLQWTNNVTGERHQLKTQLTGAYNLDNILAAICIGVYFRLPAAEINKGIEGYQPKNNRSQIVQTENNTLICDYYNANPSSMVVAIENMNKLVAYRKVLILGDMFELGETSVAEHGAIVAKALASAVTDCIFIGKDFKQAGLLAEPGVLYAKAVTFYATAEEAINELKANPLKKATILIKGSRGMALERLVTLF